MGGDCKYYYDLSAKKWWILDTNSTDWTLLTDEKIKQLQLDNQIEETINTLINKSDLNTFNTSISKTRDLDSDFRSYSSTSNIETCKSQENDRRNSEEITNKSTETVHKTPENGFRNNRRHMSYVREAARRLTYKDPGGFSGCIKVIADTRNELLKEGENINYEIQGNKSSLNYMINRAKQLAESTSKNKTEIAMERGEENTTLRKKINKELKSPCYSDGDFSTGESSDPSSTDGESRDMPINPMEDNPSTTASLAQLMAIKMKLKSKIKNLNK